MSGAFCSILVLAAVGQVDFYQDFRGRAGEMHPMLRVFGPGAAEAAQGGAEGLRITLPAERENPGPVGVSPRFTISGDFEITARYELLDVDPSSWGAGVNLRLLMGEPMQEAADMGRYVRAGEGDVHFTNRVSAAAGEPQRDVQTFPAEARTGRLRLQRRGSTLSYQVAEGTSDTFRELRQAEFVPDDCDVRLVAFAQEGVGVDIRLLDLRIQADHLPSGPVADPPRRWLRWLVLLVLVIALAAAGGLGYWRWQRKEG